MRITEISTKYKVHRSTIKKWIEKGLLRATLVSPEWGGHPYYNVTEKDLEIYFKNCDRERA